MASPSLLTNTSPKLLSGGEQERAASPKLSPTVAQSESSAGGPASPGQAASSPYLVPGQPASSPHPSPGQTAGSSHPSPGQTACSPWPSPGQPAASPHPPPGQLASPPTGGAQGGRRQVKRGRGTRGRRGRPRASRAARGAVTREALLAEGHPLAPPNSTDFLMDDHDDQPESDLLFDRYGQPTPRESPVAPHAGWGVAPGFGGWPLLEPSIARLIAEHIQMESHIEALEARIALVRQRRDSASDASDEEMQQGEVRMAPETATKIRVLEAEIRRLEEENAAIREFNDRIIDERGGGSVDSYTSDSESDSSSSSSGSSGSSRSSSSSSDSSSSGSESASPPDSPRMPASV